MISGILVTPLSRNLKQTQPRSSLCNLTCLVGKYGKHLKRISTSIDTLQTGQPSEDQLTCPFQKERIKKHFCITFYLKNTVSLTENAKTLGMVYISTHECSAKETIWTTVSYNKKQKA
jgi:hypothetical protein